MANYRKQIVAVAAAVAMAGTLAACGSSNSGGSNSGTPSAGSKGGTLYYYMHYPYEHLDPQRMYIGEELSNFKRTVYRGLVNFPISDDPAVANKPIPDLATNTGTSSDGAKTWSFTLKSGIKWQDGSPITCADFQYGASRTFATDVITGGPNYILSYLDVPTNPKTGLPVYDGPYKNDGAAAFKKAITCNGSTITYHFKKPWPDFPEAVASLDMMDPYKKSMDQGNKSNMTIFANGPYKLQGTWSEQKGGTFVRNPNYDPKTDSTKLREALPDKIVWNIGQSDNTITQLLISDSGNAKDAVTDRSIPPSFYTQINGSVAQRATNPVSPFVDYLVPNFNRLTNLKVRQALYYGTNVQGWIDAGGGTKAYAWAHSIVNPAVTGYKANPNFTAPEAGDVAKAKALLKASGAPMPYPLNFTYESTPTSDKQAAILKAQWDKVGFKTTLTPLTNTYYSVIQNPGSKADVVWAGWGADWPSAITITPPLFDSRPNGVGVKGATSNGQDYGNYKSAAFNKLVDQAQSATSVANQTSSLQQADALLGKDVAYIPLEVQKFYYLRGSNITGYMTDPASNVYPDLGAIGVK